MRQLVGAILVLAGSVLIGSGVIADGLTRDQSGPANTAYVLGTLFALVGGSLVAYWAWEAIPVDDKRSSASRQVATPQSLG